MAYGRGFLSAVGGWRGSLLPRHRICAAESGLAWALAGKDTVLSRGAEGVFEGQPSLASSAAATGKRFDIRRSWGRRLAVGPDLNVPFLSKKSPSSTGIRQRKQQPFFESFKRQEQLNQHHNNEAA